MAVILRFPEQNPSVRPSRARSAQPATQTTPSELVASEAILEALLRAHRLRCDVCRYEPDIQRCHLMEREAKEFLKAYREETRQ